MSEIPDRFLFIDRGVTDLDPFSRDDLKDALEVGEVAHRLLFMRYPNLLSVRTTQMKGDDDE